MTRFTIMVVGIAHGVNKSIVLWNGKIYHVPKDLAIAIENIIRYKKANTKIEEMILNKYPVLVKESFIEPYKWDKIFDVIFIEITDLCNYNCIHCYNGNIRKKRATSELNLRNFEIILEKFTRYGLANKIQITGGEPAILGNKLLEYVKIAIEYAKIVEIFTNGTLVLNSDLLKKLSEFNELIYVRITIPSTDQDTWVKITQSHRTIHERILKNLNKLKELNINFSIEQPLIPGINDSLKEIESVKKLAKSFETISRSRYIIPYGFAKLNNLYFDPCIGLPCDDKTIYVHDEPQKVWSVSMNYDNCLVGKVLIDTQCFYYPCLMFHSEKLGNALIDSIDVIYKKLEDCYRRYSPDKLRICKNCEFRYLCKRCRPFAEAYGLFLEREANCFKICNNIE